MVYGVSKGRFFMTQVITSIEQVKCEWLSSVLEQTVTQVHTELVSGGREGYKWRIRATGENGATYLLFLKLCSVHEARFYQAMRGHSDELPIVPCYDVVIDSGHAHILLKDLSETHDARPPSQLPPIGRECDSIVDGLADLHAHWWDNPALEGILGSALSGDQLRQFYDSEVAVYPAFADFMGDRLPAHRRAIYEVARAQLADLMVQRHAKGHLTLVFEDVHSGNFLYPRRASDPLYFVDWEQWRVTISMNDLAYMMALFWSPERRSRLERHYLEHYHARITAQGIDYSRRDMWNDYRLCVMYFLFRPALQWSRGHITEVWWNHYERISAAFEDLRCADLLA